MTKAGRAGISLTSAPPRRRGSGAVTVSLSHRRGQPPALAVGRAEKGGSRLGWVQTDLGGGGSHLLAVTLTTWRPGLCARSALGVDFLQVALESSRFLFMLRERQAH